MILPYFSVKIQYHSDFQEILRYDTRCR